MTVDRELICDYGTTFLLPIPVPVFDQPEDIDFEDTLVAEEFDYLYHLVRLIYFFNQPGHRGYVLIALGKWTYNRDLTKNINNAYDLLGFLALKYLTNCRLQVLIALYYSTVILVDLAKYQFN